MLPLLFQLYLQPFTTMSRILDEGKLLFALAIAAAVTFFLPASMFGTIGSLAFGFVPGAVIAVTLMDTLGSVSVVLSRDYMSVLTCVAMAWGAAFLPVALVLASHAAGPAAPLFLYAGAAYFIFLGACAIRTVMGTTMFRAVAGAAVGVGAAVGGSFLALHSGGILYYLASPLFLYYAYSYFQSDIGLLGNAMRSRQNFRRNLEAAAINPHDADAQYQLGLIYLQRHQLSEAEKRFRSAIAIDKEEPDAHHQLARVLMDRGNFADALPLLQRAAALNDKLAQNEVWRDMGNAQMHLNQLDEAEASLAKYTERRPYDPEGLFWHAKSLAALGRAGEAKAEFERTIEAVDTTPRNRIGRLRHWGSKARAERKKLG